MKRLVCLLHAFALLTGLLGLAAAGLAVELLLLGGLK